MGSEWGRIDDDGTVFVRTADGEREIGSWQAGDREAGLAFYMLRFDDLAAEVSVLEKRLASGVGDPASTRTQARRAQGAAPHGRGDRRPRRPRHPPRRGARRRRGEGRRGGRGPAAGARRRRSPPRRRWPSRRSRSPSRARPGRPPATGSARSSRNGARSRASTARPTTRCGSASRRPATPSAAGAVSTSPSSTPSAAR